MRASTHTSMVFFYSMFISASFINFAFAQDMLSISQYLRANGSSEKLTPADKQFIGLRCGAIYLILSQWMTENEKSSEATVFENTANSALAYAILNRDKSSDEFFNTQLPIMVKAYKERMQNSKALKGNAFGDAIISTDLEFCTSIFGKK